MQCPLCNQSMVKSTDRSMKNSHNSLKCTNCMFVIYYRGISGLDTNMQ
jgi:transcription elongation factor Elf1